MISFIIQWGINISEAIIATNSLAWWAPTEHVNIALVYINVFKLSKNRYKRPITLILGANSHFTQHPVCQTRINNLPEVARS